MLSRILISSLALGLFAPYFSVQAAEGEFATTLRGPIATPSPQKSVPVPRPLKPGEWIERVIAPNEIQLYEIGLDAGEAVEIEYGPIEAWITVQPKMK